MDIGALLPVFALALLLIGAGVIAMAIGVIFRRPCLRGSCGGVDCTCARRPRASADAAPVNVAGFRPCGNDPSR